MPVASPITTTTKTATPTFLTHITKLLYNLGDKCDSHNPDARTNSGRLIGTAFFWTQVEKFASGKRREAWDALESSHLVAVDKTLPPGDHVLAESPSFYINAKVSNPVRRLDLDVLAARLHKKYKVPIPSFKELVEEAKVEGNSTTTRSIIAR